jgi:hypothetical protein
MHPRWSAGYGRSLLKAICGVLLSGLLLLFLVVPQPAGAASARSNHHVPDRTHAGVLRETGEQQGLPAPFSFNNYDATTATEGPAPIDDIEAVNTPMAPFVTSITYGSRPRHPGEFLLHRIAIKPAATGEFAAAICSTCRFASDADFALKPVNGTLVATFRPAQPITAKTRLLITAMVDAAGTGYSGLGRYRLYAIAPTRDRVRELAQGCTAAGVDHLILSGGDYTVAALKASQPIVPCSGGVPQGDSVDVTGSTERSSTLGGNVTASGFASGARDLTIYVGTEACPQNAASVHYSTIDGVATSSTQVDGAFTVSLPIAPGTAPSDGVYCAYLENPGSYQGVADGFVSAFAGAPWFVGDTAAVAAAASVPSGQTVQFTASGFANGGTTIYVFVSAQPCASSAQGESVVGAYWYVAEGATYSYPRISANPVTTTSYVCSFVQSGDPVLDGGTPTGTVLASATTTVTAQG